MNERKDEFAERQTEAERERTTSDGFCSVGDDGGGRGSDGGGGCCRHRERETAERKECEERASESIGTHAIDFELENASNERKNPPARKHTHEQQFLLLSLLAARQPMQHHSSSSGGTGAIDYLTRVALLPSTRRRRPELLSLTHTRRALLPLLALLSLSHLRQNEPEVFSPFSPFTVVLLYLQGE